MADGEGDMTAQEHIDLIGNLTREVEAQALLVKKEVGKLRRKLHELHEAQNEAQKAYKAAHDNDNVVMLFSGGTSKPPVDDPDEPVTP